MNLLLVFASSPQIVIPVEDGAIILSNSPSLNSHGGEHEGVHPVTFVVLEINIDIINKVVFCSFFAYEEL